MPREGLWDIYDGTSSEIDMGRMLHGMICMLKPKLVVETGTYRGHTTRWLADAVITNGFGHVVTCDVIDPGPFVGRTYPEVTFKQCPSLNLPELATADFVYSDSHEDVRPSEYELVRSGCVFVIHDTDQPYKSIAPPILGEFVRSNGGLIFHAGRGFGILVKP